ncbi:Acyl-CoA dehydrogenase [Faunimonas pinastri]|uniref:Dibenzothiophene monooxygenase n=1 Tax=Faunimonas pinastri TaxID=1855383 RepID=A0A1H9K2A6_9HYPH|nr:acyl-CoA dehydrogenase family protein [Faunimonas pinastri]SEQ93220.1 Acyl-CoA dehydrogenase [Faunimonas pinastri]
MLDKTRLETLPATPDWSEPTRRLGLADAFARFAADAAERDVERRPIHAEVQELKAAGYGAVRLPTELGGAGLSLPDLFGLTRDLATADSNVAHVFRNHFHAVEQHLRTPDEPFSARLLDLARQGRMFGVAFSEVTRDPAGGRGTVPAAELAWSEAEGRYRISGTKIYSTGNMYADHLMVSARSGRTGEATAFLVGTEAEGVRLEDDWDGFGQKLTGSGRTVFDRVPVMETDLFTPPAQGPDSYGYTFHQIYLTTIVSGVVQRILIDAINLVRGRSRNYYHGLADHPRQEPEIQSVIGRIAGYRSAVIGTVERAIAALDEAWLAAGTPDAHELSVQATIAAAEAKLVTDEVAATLASLLIDVASGSGVSVRNAFDRHWRNIKVIAAHNPRIYKERVVGDFHLNGTLPPTGAFF